jgi:hypothetical protein
MAAQRYEILVRLLRTGLPEADDVQVRAEMDGLWWEMRDDERRARTPHVPPAEPPKR